MLCFMETGESEVFFLPIWFSPPSWLLLVCNTFTSKMLQDYKLQIGLEIVGINYKYSN